MRELKDIAAEAAELLPGAFYWGGTTQGHNYWAQVYLDLLDLAEKDKRDSGYYPSGDYDFKSECRPLLCPRDRQLIKEFAALIDDLLLYFIDPVLDENKSFERWAAVLQDLFALIGPDDTAPPDEIDHVRGYN